MNQPELGTYLLKRRHALKLPIQIAAQKAGINKGMVSRIEHGTDLQISTLSKILKAYRLKLKISP